jgi:hypothetical protein
MLPQRFRASDKTTLHPDDQLVVQHKQPPFERLHQLYRHSKTSPQFTAMITVCLPPVALSCNHQFQHSSS